MKKASTAALLFLVLFAAAPAFAQIGEGEIQIVELDNSNYPDIELTVDVPRSFSGVTLTESQFALQEGGVTRDITVEKLQDTTAIVLAIDTSASMDGEPLAVAKEAALVFVDGVPDNNPIAIVGFGDDVLVASALGLDRDITRAAISTLVSGGNTSLFDALVSSSALLNNAAAERFSIVLLSDGADTASGASVELVVDQLSRNKVTLYAVGLETGDSRLTELENLTIDSGGRYLRASDLSQLGDVYDDLAARIANQYRLTFAATSTGPVDVLVTVAGDGGALAVASIRTELAAAATVVEVEPVEQPVVAPAVVPELTITSAAVPGRFESPWVLWAGMAALFFTFSVIAHTSMSLTKSKPVRRGLEPRSPGSERKLSGFADWASSLVDRVFLDGTRRGAMNSALDRAGLNVRPGEFIVLTAGVAIAGLAVGWLLHPLFGVAVGITIALSARFVVGFLGSRRRARFANQLDNTLLVLASSLRAGHGIQRALAAVAEESESPTGEEFTRVVAETRIGRDLVEALQGVADRLGNDDFEWVVRAVAINRELGGNLSEVLDNVGNTIRERNQLRRQVQALSAEGKLSAIILYVLPFGVGIFVKLTNPGYIGELTQSSLGLVLIVLAGVAMLGGGVWIKKIVTVKF